jgi:hypothetical protein
MTAKKAPPRSAKKQAPVKKSPLAKKDASSLTAHRVALNDVHPELREMINNFLQEKNIPLQLHSIRFADESPGGFNCCIIAGMVHCGPECP